MHGQATSSRSWLEERFLHPVVVVAASDEADRIVLDNGMDTPQLLRPFAFVADNLFARIGDKSEVSIVRNFAARLVRPECLREMDPKGRSEHFLSLLSEESDSEFGYGEQLDIALNAILGQPNILEPKLDGTTASILLQRSFPAWQSTFVQDYCSVVRCSYFDAFDHPVANLLVAASSTDTKAILEQLQAQERRAKQPREGMPFMDDELLTYVIVVHDLTRGPPLERVIQAFGAIQNQYTAQRCALLRINGVANPQEATRPLDCQRWVTANPSVESLATNGSGKRFPRVGYHFGEWPGTHTPKVTGCCLDQANVDELQSVMTQFLSMALFPHLDRKLRTLALSINEKKQSTLSKMAAWFRKDESKGTKQEPWVPATDGGPSKYLASSLEMQMRRAGDLCMALRDFESASNYYRMCRQELQSTLNQRDFNKYLIAAAQEGIGLAQYFQGKLPLPQVYMKGVGSSSAQECRLETARDDYQRSCVHSYAFRSSLILYSYCRAKTPPNNEKALGILQQILRTGAVTSNKLYTAVLNEMCASTCLFVNPPCYGGSTGDEPPPTVQDDYPVRCRLRQFARLLTLAGSAYMEVALYQMALRCYLRAEKVFRRLAACSGTSRPLVHEHVTTIIAHLFSKVNKPLKSISYATTAVLDGVPAYSTGMRNFPGYWTRLRAVLDAQGLVECPIMPVPHYDKKNAWYLHAPRCSADEMTVQEEMQLPIDTPEREWKVLEEGLRSHYHERTPCTVPKYYADGAPGRRGYGVAAHRTNVSVPVGETVTLMVSLNNPVGGVLQVDDLHVLVLMPSKISDLCTASASGAEPTFTAADAVRVHVAGEPLQISPLGRAQLVLSIPIQQEGEHLVVGLAWKISDVAGVSLFASAASQKADTIEDGRTRPRLSAEARFEDALKSKGCRVHVRDASHLAVHGVSPQASLVVDFCPPIPSAMRNGEIYRGALRLRNIGSVAANHIVIQRSPANAHLTYFPDFSLEENEENIDRPLVLQEALCPGESRDIQMVFCARHNTNVTGHNTSARCVNNIPLLVGYAPHGGGGTVSTATPVVSSPVASSPSAASPFTQHVRLYRILRRVVVRQAMELTAQVVGVSSRSGCPMLAVTLSNRLSAVEGPVYVARAAVVVPRVSMDLEIAAGHQVTAETGVLLSDQSIAIAAALVSRDGADDANKLGAELPKLETRTLVRLEDFVRSAAKCASLRSLLPGNVGEDPVATYHATHPCIAAGALGEYLDRGGGDFSFYLDKAGGKTADELAEEERKQREASTFGAQLAQYPVLCVSVAWFSEGEDGQLHAGVQYALVDVLEQLRLSSSKLAARYLLCASLRLLRTPETSSRRAVLILSGEAPSSIKGTPASPHVARCVVRVTLRSWSPLPLRITIDAKPSFAVHRLPRGGSPHSHNVDAACSAAGVVVYVGKTKTNVVLLPHQSKTCTFTAECRSPGLCNLNTFEVTATGASFADGATKRSGGMVHSAMDTSSQRYIHPVAVVGSEAAWLTFVTLQHAPSTTFAAESGTASATLAGNSAASHVDPVAGSAIESSSGSFNSALRRSRGLSTSTRKFESPTPTTGSRQSTNVSSVFGAAVANSETSSSLNVEPEVHQETSYALSPHPKNPSAIDGNDPACMARFEVSPGGAAGLMCEGTLLADVETSEEPAGSPKSFADDEQSVASSRSSTADVGKRINDAAAATMDEQNQSVVVAVAESCTSSRAPTNSSFCHVPDVAAGLRGAELADDRADESADEAAGDS